jgi:L-ascorbate metabolism protein UlaG (beta-lactamase superfamily)
MKIRWNGHACFSLEAKEGRVITDPFAAEVPYDLPATEADVVTVSHDHFDHNAVDRIEGAPSVVRELGESPASGIVFRGIRSFHDDRGGAERGANCIYAFALDGIRVAHLGDLGHTLDSTQREALAGVEVLMIPVGGHFTIDAARAAETVRSLPCVKVAIPMHYKTNRIQDWPIETVEPFLAMMDNPRKIGGPQVELTRGSLPEALEVWVLDHA